MRSPGPPIHGPFSAWSGLAGLAALGSPPASCAVGRPGEPGAVLGRRVRRSVSRIRWAGSGSRWWASARSSWRGLTRPRDIGGSAPQVEPADVERLHCLWRLNGPRSCRHRKNSLYTCTGSGRRIPLDFPVPACDQLHRGAVVPGLLQDPPVTATDGVSPGSAQPPGSDHRPSVLSRISSTRSRCRRRWRRARRPWGGVPGITAELDRQLVQRAAR